MINLTQEADRCVKCGLCLPHCPTYTLTRQEAESPRGRIALIEALVSGRLNLTPTLDNHLQSCLQCRACEAVCPSAVNYGALMDGARELVEARRDELPKRPWRTALAWKAGLRLLAKPEHLKRGAQRLRLAQRWGLTRLAAPLGLAAAAKLLPDTLPAAVEWQPYYAPIGDRQGEVALFLGCVSQTLDAVTLQSAITVLTRLGYGVHVPPQQACCGALHAHHGQGAQAEQLAQHNAHVFAQPRLAALISCASGCGAHLSEYGTRYGVKLPTLRDISAFISNILWPAHVQLAPLPMRALVHDPCTLRNVQKGQGQVYSLLRRIPALDVMPLPGNAQCCGAAGVHMLTHSDAANALRADKLRVIAQQKPDLLVTSNIGCALHLASGLREQGVALEVIHPITLLARQLLPSITMGKPGGARHDTSATRGVSGTS